MRTINIDLYSDETLIRFWAKVQLAGQDQCWLWQGAADKWGYGRFGFYIVGVKKQVLATRFSYTITKGPVPNGELVLHSCDNPACVNPNHLYAGTHNKNMEDMKVKGRAYKPLGEKNANAKLIADDVLLIIKLGENGLKPKEIAPRFGVSRRCVEQIILRKRWAWLTNGPRL